jgi:hypothetical protein
MLHTSKGKLVWLVDEFETTGVIFIHNQLVHPCVDKGLVVEEGKVRYTWEMKAF